MHLILNKEKCLGTKSVSVSRHATESHDTKNKSPNNLKPRAAWVISRFAVCINEIFGMSTDGSVMDWLVCRPRLFMTF